MDLSSLGTIATGASTAATGTAAEGAGASVTVDVVGAVAVDAGDVDWKLEIVAVFGFKKMPAVASASPTTAVETTYNCSVAKIKEIAVIMKNTPANM